MLKLYAYYEGRMISNTQWLITHICNKIKTSNWSQNIANIIVYNF
jgi:hypothetical protein